MGIDQIKVQKTGGLHTPGIDVCNTANFPGNRLPF